MSTVDDDTHDRFGLTLIEDRLWIATANTGFAKYDFAFENHFACKHPIVITEPITAIARMGAANDYDKRYADLAALNVHLIHSPSQYERTSDLRIWYPLLRDLTPRSIVYGSKPSAAQVAGEFGWPVFAKGIHQTSRHQRRLSVIESAAQFDAAMEEWEADPILRWQPLVCREMLTLRAVSAPATHVIQPSFEFRSFWWDGRCVGFGRYWGAFDYECTEQERQAAIAIAGEAATRIDVPFLVVDVAQDVNGRWSVIEVNDGQDSGYAAVDRRRMWRRILDADEAKRSD